MQRVISSPIGPIGIQASKSGLTHLWFIDQDNQQRESSLDPCSQSAKILDQTEQQLSAFFAGKLPQFSLPLAPKGTEFQCQVWQALTEIPFNQTVSYSDIANAIARPKSVRAVGAANGANPIPIIIPCHRVIGKNGKLTGYAYGLALKQTLLDIEARSSSE